MNGSPTKPSREYLLSSSSTPFSTATPHKTRTLRRFQSAQTLSSNPSTLNSTDPSLTSHLRQQQQQQQQQSHQQQQQRTIPNAQKDLLPSPHLDSPARPSHNRARSNSDAPVMSISQSGPTSKKIVMAKKIIGSNPSAKSQLEGLVREGPLGGDLNSGLNDLRHLVLIDGLDADSDGMSALRIYIWLILLSAPSLATDTYLDLIHRGPSPAYSKIRNDTFRTLATDPLFKRRVSEASLIRLLNAVAWKLYDAKTERMSESGKLNTSTREGSPELQQILPLTKHQGPRTATTDGSEAGGSESGIYVQGMNVLCAPFLYAARSEAEAFVAFHRFLTRECPGYVRGAMDGVHKGLALVDQCLAIVDFKLAEYLLSKGMYAEIYAFASVLTFCACTPPLPEVLCLWDFLFSYGAHLNILCICAQLVMMRDVILANPSPTKILRSFPPLKAKEVRNIAVSFVAKMPADIYEELVNHAK